MSLELVVDEPAAKKKRAISNIGRVVKPRPAVPANAAQKKWQDVFGDASRNAAKNGTTVKTELAKLGYAGESKETKKKKSRHDAMAAKYSTPQDPKRYEKALEAANRAKHAVLRYGRDAVVVHIKPRVAARNNKK